jgi:hypothetical protein
MLLNFFVHKLRIYVIIYCVDTLQTSPAYLIVSGKGQEPNLEVSTWKFLQKGRLLLYQQTLDAAEMACQRQTL